MKTALGVGLDGIVDAQPSGHPSEDARQSPPVEVARYLRQPGASQRQDLRHSGSVERRVIRLVNPGMAETEMTSQHDSVIRFN